MSDRRLLVLWDVDHTLIENAGVSKKNYATAFELLTGRRPERPARTDGRTDPEIMRGLLLDNAADPGTFTERELRIALAEAMKRNVYELLRRGSMLPGVAETLTTLSEIDLVVQSVLTGNIEPNAATKLRLLGESLSALDLEVGGYGSDAPVRASLVRIAQAKATRKYGYEFGPSDTVLVGDTERDVEAALNGGALVIGVATGHASEDELSAAGAHATVADLTDPRAVVETLAKVTGIELHARPTSVDSEG